jgi:murein DD-endopeptidase MepM/ murein hydrolase activator NlpD
VEAAATSPMAEAAADIAEAADEVVDATPESLPLASDAAASEAAFPAADPAASADADPAAPFIAADSAEEQTPTADEHPAAASGPSARARKTAGPHRRPASMASSAAKPAQAARPARAPRTSGRRRVWQMTGAALAVASLVGGTALPALGMVRGETSAVTASVSADLRTQSFTAGADVLPDVVVSGEFSATTPDELKELQAVAAATARSGVPPIAKPGQIIVPMAAGTYTMTDGFGASRPGRSHMGQDYAAPIGTPIYASADGVVTMSQDSYGGYGVTVQVQHDEDGSVTTLYGHMNYGTRAVQPGDHVVAGQFLGRVGNTGYTIGSCLHFEVRINGAQINPVPWLEAHVR